MPRPRRRHANIVSAINQGSRTHKRFTVNPASKVSRAKARRPKGEKSRKFKAKYASICPACDQPWAVGDPIRRCGQFYYHDECVK